MKNVRWMSALGLSLILAGYAAAQAKVESIETAKAGNGVQISVNGMNIPAPKITISQKGKVVFFDFYKTHLAGKTDTDKVGYNGISSVKAGWFGRPSHARITVYCATAYSKPYAVGTAQGWTLIFDSATPATQRDPYAGVYSKNAFGELPKIQTGSNPNFKPAGAKTQVEEAAKTESTETLPGNALIDAAKTAPPITQAKTTDAVTAPVKTLTSHLLEAGVIKPSAKSEPIVSLDFTNTEVILILRALADQSGVNIVSSPDVGGRVSVNLERVTLTEALNLVTTIANVRYTKIGKTFLVTSTARFSDAIRQVIGKLDDAGETRVLQLKSGEGKQIKAATLKAIPQLASNGYYDLILPTEKISAKTSSGSGATQGTGQANAGVAGGGSASASQQGGAGGGSAQGQGSGTASSSVSGSGVTESQGTSVELTTESSGSGAKDAYVVIVGTEERMKEVSDFIRTLDLKIADANSMTGAGVSTRIVPLYSPNSDVIVDSLKNWIARDPKSAAFKVALTNGPSIGKEETTKLLVLTGPMGSLDTLEALARSTDSGIAAALGLRVPSNEMEAQKNYTVVDLKWIEPLEAATELEKRVRGLSATLMPAPVDPLVDGKKKIGNESTSGQQSAQGASTQATEGSQTQGSQSAAGAANVGAESSQSTENAGLSKKLGTEPMKLLLYGTQSQIQQAQSLLMAIDIEPKMIAIDLRVIELSTDVAQKLGLNWSVGTNGLIKSIKLNNLLTSTGAGQLSGSGNSGKVSATGGLDLDELSSLGKVITRPNTIALDGRLSTIFIGDTIRYVEQIQSSQNGVTVTTGKVDVGVTLNVVPRVSPDGTISMNLNPNFTILKGFTAIPNNGQLPQTSTRSTTGSVVMGSNDTIALGGLIQESDSKTLQGIPFLKDLPILGRLFRSESTKKSKTEIVFFITAKVVSRDGIKAADPRHSRTVNPADPNKNGG